MTPNNTNKRLTENSQLRDLAALMGLELGYVDAFGKRIESPEDAVIGVIRALGLPLKDNLENVKDLLRYKRQEKYQHLVNAVTASFIPDEPLLSMVLPEPTWGKAFQFGIQRETGEIYSWSSTVEQMGRANECTIEGVGYKEVTHKIPMPLEEGVYSYQVEVSGNLYTGTLFRSLATSFLKDMGNRKLWGVCVPLYALHSLESWGIGDFTDLERLWNWLASKGGGFLGSLPMNDCFHHGSLSDASPYRPISRLFWDEIFVDPRRYEHWSECLKAQDLAGSMDFMDKVSELNTQKFVVYEKVLDLKSKVLREMSREFYSRPEEYRQEFNDYLKEKPIAVEYARFKAVYDKRDSGWGWWPESWNGQGTVEDFSADDEKYHLFVQWLAERQLDQLSAKSQKGSVCLYLDFPLGVHPEGYDVWKEKDKFVTELSVGAPPDQAFVNGQNWGFPPYHPEHLESSGYSYFRESLGTLMKKACIIRIDHIMGFHRLFCIPQGMNPSDGVYMNYPSSHFYSCLTLQSHKYRTMVIGEDLGTVPPYVRTEMADRKVTHMYIMQYELEPRQDMGYLNAIPENSIACLHTHDMFPFGAYWEGADARAQKEMGFLNDEQLGWELEKRKNIRLGLSRYLGRMDLENATGSEGFEACVEILAESRAYLMLLNLEDLWGEMEPQNVPGTQYEQPNFRRRFLASMESFFKSPRVDTILKKVNVVRNQGDSGA